MNFWTPAEFQRITQGRWLTEPAASGLALRGVGIDSRTIGTDECFIAIKGEHFDGHDYVDAALNKGAAFAIVEHEVAPRRGSIPGALQRPFSVLLVDDCITALQSLARTYRDILASHNVQVIGVTGSNGKTTTRHLIHAVLSAKLKGTQSPKSFNNHLGVPLTILGASADDDFLVAEVGTNHPGEIAHLSEILRPDVGVITTIGCAHAGHFDEHGGVAREKASLLKFITPKGHAVLSRQAHAAIQEHDRVPADLTLRLYGFDEPSDVAGAFAGSTGNDAMRIGGRPVRFHLLGPHNLENALAAVEVGRILHVDEQAMADALESVHPVPMRLQMMEFGVNGSTDHGVTVINDAYNSNPDSLLLALRIIQSQRARHDVKRRVAVLGDMLELGDDAPSTHAVLAAGAWQYGLNLMIAIGPIFNSAPIDRETVELSRIRFFPQWNDDLPRKVADLLRTGDVVLIKGSRGMRLERLIPAIEEKFGKQQE